MPIPFRLNHISIIKLKIGQTDGYPVFRLDSRSFIFIADVNKTVSGWTYHTWPSAYPLFNDRTHKKRIFHPFPFMLVIESIHGRPHGFIPQRCKKRWHTSFYVYHPMFSVINLIAVSSLSPSVRRQHRHQ